MPRRAPDGAAQSITKPEQRKKDQERSAKRTLWISASAVIDAILGEWPQPHAAAMIFDACVGCGGRFMVNAALLAQTLKLVVQQLELLVG